MHTQSMGSEERASADRALTLVALEDAEVALPLHMILALREVRESARARARERERERASERARE